MAWRAGFRGRPTAKMADGQDNKLALGAMLKASAAQQMLQVGERGHISSLMGFFSLDAAGTLQGAGSGAARWRPLLFLPPDWDEERKG